MFYSCIRDSNIGMHQLTVAPCFSLLLSCCASCSIMLIGPFTLYAQMALNASLACYFGWVTVRNDQRSLHCSLSPPTLHTPRAGSSYHIDGGRRSVCRGAAALFLQVVLPFTKPPSPPLLLWSSGCSTNVSTSPVVPPWTELCIHPQSSTAL